MRALVGILLGLTLVVALFVYLAEDPSPAGPLERDRGDSKSAVSLPTALDRAAADPLPSRVVPTAHAARADASPKIPRLVGSVRDSSWNPVRGAQVVASVELGSRSIALGTAKVGASGGYELSLPGLASFLQSEFALMVEVSAPEFGDQSRRAALQSREELLWRCSFNLSKGVDIHGRVVDEQGNPVVDATVRALRFMVSSTDIPGAPPLSPWTETRTWSNGGFRLDLPPDAHAFVSARHDDFGVGVIDAGPVTELREDEIIEIKLSPLRVQGQVRFSDGAPVSRLSLFVNSTGSYPSSDPNAKPLTHRERSLVVTDENGRFELTSVFPGWVTFGVSDHLLEPQRASDRVLIVTNSHERTRHGVLIQAPDQFVQLEYSRVRLRIGIDGDIDKRALLVNGERFYFGQHNQEDGSPYAMADFAVRRGDELEVRFEDGEAQARYTVMPVPSFQTLRLDLDLNQL